MEHYRTSLKLMSSLSQWHNLKWLSRVYLLGSNFLLCMLMYKMAASDRKEYNFDNAMPATVLSGDCRTAMAPTCHFTLQKGMASFVHAPAETDKHSHVCRGSAEDQEMQTLHWHPLGPTISHHNPDNSYCSKGNKQLSKRERGLVCWNILQFVEGHLFWVHRIMLPEVIGSHSVNYKLKIPQRQGLVNSNTMSGQDIFPIDRRRKAILGCPIPGSVRDQAEWGVVWWKVSLLMAGGWNLVIQPKVPSDPRHSRILWSS